MLPPPTPYETALHVAKQSMKIVTLDTNIENELLDARRRLLSFAEAHDSTPDTEALNAIWEQTKVIGKSASGSWLGYHANVYYAGFKPPPAGVHFDVDNGTAGTCFSGPDLNWIELTGQEVFDLILDEQAKASLTASEARSEEGLALFNSVREDVLSLLTVYLQGRDDKFAGRIAEEIEAAKVLNAAEIANNMSPNRQVITRDMRAIQQGTWAPPHIKVQARITAAHQPAAHCRELAGKLDKLASHLARVAKLDIRSSRIGTNVFIGHGRSTVWRDLKDFIQDRLRLPWDEFNRVPVAGITNITRLSDMLDSAACAFVIMTAEDELADGTTQARMNVIHEVGLFQGRLGFTKAIVLLEDGCQEFSNIQGLGQIRFPKGSIAAKFEEIRQVLEREGVIDGPKNTA